MSLLGWDCCGCCDLYVFTVSYLFCQHSMRFCLSIFGLPCNMCMPHCLRFFFHVQSHLRCVDGSDGRNTIAWVMKEEQCARTARFTHDIYGAYHGAPLECGDGAGDGPHMASAVTSPGYAGCQDPAKRVTVTSDMARPLTRPVTSVTPSCLKGKGPSKIPKNPKQKMEKKKESAPHIISHSGIIAYLLYCSVHKMLHF